MDARDAKLLLREAWKRGPRGLAARLGEAMRSGRTWLETRYQSDLVRALFAPWVLHAGLGPESAFSGEIGRVIAFAMEAAGAPIVKGGATKAVAAFKALIEEQGGEVRTGADVVEIVISDGGASGVRIASGETITAAKRRDLLSDADAALRTPSSEERRRQRRPRACGKLSLRQGRHADPLRAEGAAALEDAGARQRRAAAPHARPRRRVEGRQRMRARHAAGSPDDLRRPAACARSVALSGRRRHPVDPASRSAARDQRRRCGQDRSRRRNLERSSPRGLRRPRRSDPRAAHRRLRGECRGAARLFPCRPRGDEHQSRRRRSVWRRLDHRPGLHLAAVRQLREPPDRDPRPLPDRRLDPSGRRTLRRLRALRWRSGFDEQGRELPQGGDSARPSAAGSRPSARSGSTISPPIS